MLTCNTTLVTWYYIQMCLPCLFLKLHTETSTIIPLRHVEGKRRLCDLNVTNLSPALATRNIRSQ